MPSEPNGKDLIICMLCERPAIDSGSVDFKGLDGCCEDSEWGYCQSCDCWTERPANWATGLEVQNAE